MELFILPFLPRAALPITFNYLSTIMRQIIACNHYAHLLRAITLICLFFIFMVSNGYANSKLTDVRLTMMWEAAEPMRLTHQFKVDSSILGNNISWFYEGEFTRKITQHEEGLLVTHSDFKLIRADLSESNQRSKKNKKRSKSKNKRRQAIDNSEVKNLLAKLAVAGIVMRPNFIMSPKGEFIRFYEYEKYKASNSDRVAQFVGAKQSKYLEFYKPVVNGLAGPGVLKKAIQKDLALWSKWNTMTLISGQPETGEISVYASNKKNKNNDVPIEGEFSVGGSAKCHWDVSSDCVSLYFKSKNDNLYDVHMIVEPNTLTPHSYQITSKVIEDLSKQEGFEKIMKIFAQRQGGEIDPNARVDLSYKINVKRISK